MASPCRSLLKIQNIITGFLTVILMSRKSLAKYVSFSKNSSISSVMPDFPVYKLFCRLFGILTLSRLLHYYLPSGCYIVQTGTWVALLNMCCAIQGSKLMKLAMSY